MIKASFILLFMSSMLACNTSENDNLQDNKLLSGWPGSAVTYEIFVQSFADSDGDSIGDIPGMTQKLDYLADLGAEAVWLMPIMPSPSYHKYDVTDYKAIHADYGTMDDFKQFVSQAHDRDIKVIIDLIINHSSSEHPWFLSAKNDKDSPYRDYYVWADKDSVAEQIAKKQTSFDSDNITQWHAVDGDTTAEHYYGFFYGGMPDLNYDNPKLREEVYGIGRYWLEEVGVDGFRLDAAKHIYPDDLAEENHAFWVEFKEEMEKVKPDVYLVGEVWANTDTQAPYTKGFSALFNFDLAFTILQSVQNHSSVAATIEGDHWQMRDSLTLVDTYREATEKFKRVNPDFFPATFLSNHDQNRVMTFLNNDEVKARLAASILLTMPGNPYIYYGEEIGMRGHKPDEYIREPFLWTNQEKDDFRANWIRSRYSTDSTVTPLSKQMADENSIYNHYKGLIHARRKSAALTFGTLESWPAGKQLLAYIRKKDDQEVLVVHNLSTTEATVDTEAYHNIYYSTSDQNKVLDQKLALAPLSSVVLSK